MSEKIIHSLQILVSRKDELNMEEDETSIDIIYSLYSSDLNELMKLTGKNEILKKFLISRNIFLASNNKKGLLLEKIGGLITFIKDNPKL